MGRRGAFTNDRSGKKVTIGQQFSGDKTLYARWAHSFIDVKLEENGGSEVDDIKLFDNDKFELPTPTRYGYSFDKVSDVITVIDKFDKL